MITVSSLHFLFSAPFGFLETKPCSCPPVCQRTPVSLPCLRAIARYQHNILKVIHGRTHTGHLDDRVNPGANQGKRLVLPDLGHKVVRAHRSGGAIPAEHS